MSVVAANDPCPCGSGYIFMECCGSADRTSRKVIELAAFDPTRNQAQLTPQLNEALASIATRPDLFPVRVNFQNERVRWIKMSLRWYRDSVFLDASRIKGACALESDLSLLRDACDQTSRNSAAFIFHTAFCGSTLMSQTLAAAFRSLPLREPDVLGNLLFYLKSSTASDQDKRTWLERIVRILARRYSPDEPAVIKANDYANGLMLDLLHACNDTPILFMYTRLAEFVVGCMKAENRRAWVRERFSLVKSSASPLLAAHATAGIAEDAYAEMAALYWSFNIALYLEAQQAFPQRTRCLEFNHMLDAPHATATACAKFFGLRPLPDVDLAQAIDGLFGVYSKNAEFRYSPQQRRNEISRLTAKFATEVAVAERCARAALQHRYPETYLPGELENA